MCPSWTAAAVTTVPISAGMDVAPAQKVSPYVVDGGGGGGGGGGYMSCLPSV